MPPQYGQPGMPGAPGFPPAPQPLGTPGMFMAGQPTFVPAAPQHPSIGHYHPENPMPESVAHANAIQNWPTHSVYVKCLSCQRSGYTKITKSLKPVAILFTIFLFFLLFILALFMLCCECSYSTEHHCSHCGCHLGTGN